MLPINEMNQLFLATHPDIRRKIRAAYRKSRPAVIGPSRGSPGGSCSASP